MRTTSFLQGSWIFTMAMLVCNPVGSVYATGPTITPMHQANFHGSIADANTPAANPYMQDEYNNNNPPVIYPGSSGVNVYAPGAGVGGVGVHGEGWNHPGAHPGEFHGGHPGERHGMHQGMHQGMHGEHGGAHHHSEHGGHHGR